MPATERIGRVSVALRCWKGSANLDSRIKYMEEMI